MYLFFLFCLRLFDGIGWRDLLLLGRRWCLFLLNRLCLFMLDLFRLDDGHGFRSDMCLLC